MVYLSRAAEKEEPTEILSFNDDLVENSHVEMRWLTDTHLEVTYHRNAKIEFQVIKCAGVDISIRHLLD